MQIPLSSIDASDRARTDLGDLSGIADSLKNLGTISPIVLSKNNDGTSFKLIVGRRRMAAAERNGIKELSHGSILEPGKVGFLFREEVPEDVLKEAELDENLWRLKPKWQEDCLLIADVHELKRDKEGRKWGTRQTAALLGYKDGRTTVSHALRLAKLIKAKDADIMAADNMSEAMAILFKRKEEEALAELHRRAGDRIATGQRETPGVSIGGVQPLAGTSSFLDEIHIDLGPKKSLAQSAVGEQVGPTEISEPIEIPLSRMFRLGDCLEIMKTSPDSSFDHIVTDIPYGIDMKNLDTRDMSAVADEHDVEQNVSMMEPFLQQAFRLVKSGGFCVFFYDLDWHEYLQSTAEQIGWKVQRWPLIFHKTSTCQNNAAQYNFTKNYECAMVLRRDEKTVLRSQQPSSLWMGDFAAERRLYNNPFAKPFTAWKFIYDAIAFSGQSILDPFCGEMSGCHAAVNCGLIPYGIELKESHYLRGLEHMKAVYALVHKSNVSFI